MNRKWMIVLILMMLSLSLKAQQHFYPSRPRNNAALYEGPVYGIKMGVNCPRLYYSNAYLGEMSHDLMVTPSAGLFLEVPFLRSCTVAPELNYQQRGGSFTYLYDQHIKETYRLQASYLSLRVPVYLYIPISDRVKPYLFVAPELSRVVGGKVSMTHPDQELPDYQVSINRSNIKYAYLGALGGAGLRINMPLSTITIVLKADVAINWGFLDTYSSLEHAGTSHPVNGVQSYHIDGRRDSRGVEMHLGLGFFINKYDACGSFQ